MQAAIEVRAIGQRTRFSNVTLRDISLTVSRGELVAIIGGSGSGKTALLDVMSGLRSPSSGTVRRECEHVGYVPDADTLNGVLPLARALSYTAAIRGVRHSESEITDALRAAGLASRAADPVGELDPGERKRAAIAAELPARPAFLFLEEPTAALDPAQGAEVMRLLRRRCDDGTTVVFTTHSPLDADRCDKVAVLAAGGHLAFFGTAQAACGYFGADSLDEIFERLAGLGDPATAWSRRFFHFAQASRGFLVSPTIPPQPGVANLVPDYAGPHSAGRPGAALVANGFGHDEVADDEFATERTANDQNGHDGLAGDGFGNDLPGYDRLVGDEPADSLSPTDPRAPSLPPSAAADAEGGIARARRSVRQLPRLVARNVEQLRHDRPGLAVLAAAPLAVLLALAVLLPAGALGPEHSSAACMAWAVLGVFAAGLAYGLPQVRSEAGVVRAERFAGLSSVSYVLAKLAVLLPAIAVGDALILLVPALSGRLPAEGYGAAFALLLLSSVVALALALLLSAAFPAVPAALAFPLFMVAAALLAILVTLARPVWADLLVLAALSVALLITTTVLISRGTSAPLARGSAAHESMER